MRERILADFDVLTRNGVPEVPELRPKQIHFRQRRRNPAQNLGCRRRLDYGIIRTRLENGVSCTKIGRLVGANPGSVRRIARRQGWRVPSIAEQKITELA
jgi:hypothetical protein